MKITLCVWESLYMHYMHPKENRQYVLAEQLFIWTFLHLVSYLVG